MKNRYSFRSRIPEIKTREIVRCSSADLTALQTAELTGTNRNAINRIYLGLRQRILIACEEARPMFGVVEVDESLFGPRRVKGKRGRGAYGKTTVFGIFEHDGQVYAEIVPNCAKPTLQGIIRGHVGPATVINSPSRQICDANRLPGNGRLARLQRPGRPRIRGLAQAYLPPAPERDRMSLHPSRF